MTQLLSYRRVRMLRSTNFALGSTPCGSAEQTHKGTRCELTCCDHERVVAQDS